MDETEQKATDLGWSPKENFRGDPDKWISAEAYLKRGEDLMPILKANNRKLHGEIAELRGNLTETKTLLANATESIAALKEFTTKATVQAAKETKKELARELKEARKDGDTELELEIEDKLHETREAIKKAEEAPPAKQTPRATVDEAAFNEWKKDNPRFDEDPLYADVTITVGRRLRQDPAYKDLTGRKFLDKVADEVDKVLDKPRSNGAAKVAESSRSSGKGGSGEGTVKSYVDLPPEAKQSCENFAKKLVGPGRAYKDTTEWRKAYTQDYFKE